MCDRLEFGIWEVEVGEDVLRVTGMVNEADVLLGAVFNAVDWRHIAPGRKVSSVNLRVARIVSYGHDFDELSGGVTGELTLEGDCFVELVRSAILSGPVA